MTITVESNDSNKNLAKNKLKGLKFRRNTVFFGVNGAGKSTICETLSTTTDFKSTLGRSDEKVRVFSFDRSWRSERVGKFVEGGKANGVTTVALDSNAGMIEAQLSANSKERAELESELSELESRLDDIRKRQSEVLDSVSEGIRRDLEKRCSALSGRKFRRNVIVAKLNEGGNLPLASKEVEDKLNTANADNAGFISKVSALPRVITLSDEIWDEITTTPENKVKNAKIIINEWVVEGMKLHPKPTDCTLCGNPITQERIDELNSALDAIRADSSGVVKDYASEVKDALDSFRELLSELKRFDIQTTVYGEQLRTSLSDLVAAIEDYIGSLNKLSNLITTILTTNDIDFEIDRPEVNPDILVKKYGIFTENLGRVQAQIGAHEENQKDAVSALQRHCCAIDGAGWQTLSDQYRKTDELLSEVKVKITDNKAQAANLNSQISTTAETAKFLDKNLRMVLGEDSLRVEEGEEGEGYVITRRGKNATYMSEGEKKLVALLYFCAEFRTESRKEFKNKCLVLLDDIGTELDEGRLLAVDRFIADFFTDRCYPANVAYFTHSHKYFKILRNRLGRKCAPYRENGKEKNPSSVFYEVYKPLNGESVQSTEWREWNPEMVKLTNDYLLSLYLVAKALLDRNDGQDPDPGVGNNCRKVLEGFTDFKSPGSDQFGDRLAVLLLHRDMEFSPSLSKLVNELSHSDLQRSTGVLTNSEVDRSVTQTLRLMYEVDKEHLENSLKHLLAADDFKRVMDILEENHSQKEVLSRT